MKKFLSTALLALVGLAASADAQIQANLNDLILGFRASGGVGQSSNLEVDLGSISQFYGQPAGTSFVVTRLSPSDLIAIYGSNWNTRTDLVWGIVGSSGRVGSGGPNSQPLDTLWATNAELTPGTQSTAWTQSSRSGQSYASSIIEALYLGAPGSLNGQTATANSAYAANVVASLAGSYTAQDTTQAGESFAFFNPSIDNSTTILLGTYAVSDLFQLEPGSGASTYVGSFGLAANGTLTFSNNPAYFTQVQGNSVFSTQPVSQTVVSGTTVVFSAAATGNPSPSYQWYFNGAAISGATSSQLVVSNATSANAGSYTCVATNTSGSNSSTAATLTLSSTTNVGRLINLSVNTIDGSGAQSMTVGFVSGGAGTSGSQTLLIRASGPALTAYGVSGVLPDPVLTLFNTAGAVVISNAGWASTSANETAVLAADSTTGAFSLTNPASLDSAVVETLAESGYTVQVAGKSGDSGRTIAEVYDDTASGTYTLATPRLVNVSCRIQVSAGSSLTTGFTIGGTTSKSVLIRASGPALTAFGVNGVMPDPQLQLFTGSTQIASNAGWGGNPQLTAAMNAVYAFTYSSPTSKDSALLVTLPPGTYTAVASSVSGTAGITLVEVYEVP